MICDIPDKLLALPMGFYGLVTKNLQRFLNELCQHSVFLNSRLPCFRRRKFGCGNHSACSNNAQLASMKNAHHYEKHNRDTIQFRQSQGTDITFFFSSQDVSSNTEKKNKQPKKNTLLKFMISGTILELRSFNENFINVLFSVCQVY